MDFETGEDEYVSFECVVLVPSVLVVALELVFGGGATAYMEECRIGAVPYIEDGARASIFGGVFFRHHWYDDGFKEMLDVFDVFVSQWGI
jgi:hypothetical protein